MSLCLNPDCLHKNAPTDKFCQKCCSKLLLRERYRSLKLIGQGGFGKTFQAVDEDKPSKPYCVSELLSTELRASYFTGDCLKTDLRPAFGLTSPR
jgi:hypothetical protein